MERKRKCSSQIRKILLKSEKNQTKIRANSSRIRANFVRIRAKIRAKIGKIRGILPPQFFDKNAKNGVIA